MNDYNEYARLLSEIADIEVGLLEKKYRLGELRQSILDNSDDGSIALQISDHAFSRASHRLRELSSENPIIYRDVFPPAELEKSMLTPENLESFIITTISKSRDDESFTSKKSRSGGVEFVYTVNMSKWSTANKQLYFVAVVENNNVKTIYFNWQEK